MNKLYDSIDNVKQIEMANKYTSLMISRYEKSKVKYDFGVQLLKSSNDLKVLKTKNKLNKFR